MLNAAALFMEMPTDINEECRSACLLDFEHGRGHLMFQIALKTSCFLEPPLVILGCAHHDPENPEKQKDVLRKCLSSDCNRPQFQKLREPGLREEIELFLEGEDRRMLEKLSQFLGSLRFAWGTERRVEGGHAQVNMFTQGRRNRTEATDSLVLRLGEIKRVLTSADVVDFLQCVQAARNPQRLVASLGLRRHPSCLLAKSAWDPIYRKVVYHADPLSLYNRNPPELFIEAPASRRRPGQSVQEALQDKEPADDDVPSEVAGLWKSLALVHVRSSLQDCAKSSAGRKLFSCDLSSAALKLLFESVVAPPQKEPAADAERESREDIVVAAPVSSCKDSMIAEASATGVAFFRVVHASLSRAKLAAAADFDSNDIGILLWQSSPEGHDSSDASYRVDTNGVALPSALATQYGLKTAPLVLALSSLTLRQLRSLTAWDEPGKVAVDEASGTTSVLAKEGQKLLAFPSDSNLALSDYSTFQLVEKLRLDGWECVVARNKRAQSLARLVVVSLEKKTGLC